MTLSEFAESMADEFGEAYTDLDIAEQFRRWAQETIDEVYTAARWFFKNSQEDLTTGSGVRIYTLSPNASEIRDMRWSGAGGLPAAYKGQRISYLPVERLIARGYDLTETGIPVAWYYTGVGTNSELKIGLYPVPNASGYEINIYTLIRPPAYAAADTIALPTEYIRVCRDNVRALVYDNDGNPQQAQVARAKFEQGIAMLNARFSGPQPRLSRLRIKGAKQTHQAPAAADGA